MVSDFLSSVGEKWKMLYWYLPPITIRADCAGPAPAIYTFPSGYQAATPDTTQSMAWKLAFWMSALGSGISCFPADIPDWVITENVEEDFYGDESYDGGSYYEYNWSDCTYLNDEFWFDFEGYTDEGNYIYLDFDGEVNWNTWEVYGWDDCCSSEVWNSEIGSWEYIDFSFQNGEMHDYDGEIELVASFSGTTNTGREITGTFDVWFDESGTGDDGCDYYYYYLDEIYVTGTITDSTVGDFDIDDSIMEDIAPVVIPGYGYWVWMDSAGWLVPSVGTSTGFGQIFMPAP
jgi:hypothetical protein